MNILDPSQWSANTDPNNNELSVGGATYFVQNAGQSWSLTTPATNTLRFEVRPGDVWSAVDPSSKERSEIAATTTYGNDTQINISYNFQVEPGATNNASWLVAGQLHQTASDGWSPPFEIDFNGGDQMSISINEAGNSANSWSAYHTIYTDPDNIVRGHTYSMQIVADFDPVNGHLEVIRDGVVLVDYHGALGYSGMGDVYWKEGVYRAASNTDIAMDYSDLSVTTGSTSTGSGSGSGSGSDSGSGSSGGSTTAPTEGSVTSTPTTVSHGFLQNGVSDLLIENTNGTLAVGEVSNGVVSYANVGGVGSEWSFHGAGVFSGDGHDQFLMENASGTVAIGELQNGKAVYTAVSGLGSEWTIESTGNYLADGKDQFLIENSNGSVDVGEISNGQTTYTKVAALGSEWSFKGSGDFLGSGHDQFLIENTNGTVAVGDIQNGQATYTNVASLGAEWKFGSVGDFLGDGKSQFLIENTNGTVALGEVGSNGKVAYTTIGALGSEWKFVGAGDYLHEGHDQYALENSSGQVVVADVQNGVAHYTTVSALGSEWTFHS